MTVQDVGGMDFDRQDQAVDIDQQVTFASLNLFASIIAAFVASHTAAAGSIDSR